MSKTNAFSSFADAAESKPKEIPQVLLQDSFITVKELLEALQQLVENNPDAADAVVKQACGPGLEETTTVTLHKGSLIFTDC